MARTYKRDARGRFTGGGYSGQSGGRGARLTAKGTRQGGGAKMKAARVGGTVAKPRGLKPGAIKAKVAAAPAKAKAASRLKWEKVAGTGGRRSTAKISDRLRVNVAESGPGSFSGAVVNTKTGQLRMERRGFRNVSEAKAWGQRPSARGERLAGGWQNVESAPQVQTIRRKASRPASTVAKPSRPRRRR